MAVLYRVEEGKRRYVVTDKGAAHMRVSPKRLALKHTAVYMLFFFLPFTLIVDYTLRVFVSWIRRERTPFSVASAFGGETLGTGICAGVMAYIAFRNLFDPTYHRSSTVDHITYLTLQLPYHVAFQRCLDSLRVVGNPIILVESETRGVIDAAVLPGPFWKRLFLSYGDRVQFQLGSDTKGESLVKITSRSPLPHTIFDFGHQERNVRRLAHFLQT